MNGKVAYRFMCWLMDLCPEHFKPLDMFVFRNSDEEMPYSEWMCMECRDKKKAALDWNAAQRKRMDTANGVVPTKGYRWGSDELFAQISASIEPIPTSTHDCAGLRSANDCWEYESRTWSPTEGIRLEWRAIHWSMSHNVMRLIQIMGEKSSGGTWFLSDLNCHSVTTLESAVIRRYCEWRDIPILDWGVPGPVAKETTKLAGENS